MIFENETEFNAYIDGYLITQKFFGEIEKELRNAVTKHPKFCNAVLDPDSRVSWAESEYRIKARNAMTKDYSDNILMEEVAEAFNAYQHGDKKNALKEFAQVGAVVLRCMEFISKEMEAET
jgi:NTP pyrophosphatase (non-canonical NTP hydrolase)